jgi:hypothetical protein
LSLARQTFESVSQTTAKERKMSNQQFPPGWDEARVRRLIAHYEQMDEDEQLAEDEAVQEAEGQTIMVIPTELVPAVRELIARKGSD